MWGRPGWRPGRQQGTVLVQLVIGIGKVGHGLDLGRMAAAFGEQGGHLDQAFLARACHLGEWRS
jgi:hypothetical protein